MISKTQEIIFRKNLSLRLNYKFGVILGQISGNISKDQKRTKKGQISKYIESRQIIYQNQALGISFFKNKVN